jgi:CDP-diacylglycerol--glycerol-3-phosphate 3-phosphatidyltransferase
MKGEAAVAFPSQFPSDTRRMTTANKITIARILMIPLFVMMAIYYGRSVQIGAPLEWQRWMAIAIFVIAAASDGVDGYIARRYNQKSQLGVILDPIADKGLLLAGIITLSFSNWAYEFPIWFPVLVIARDVIIVSGTLALHYLNGSVRVKPSWTGKTATVFQMIAIACVMLQLNFFETTFQLGTSMVQLAFLDLPVYLAGLFTAISGAGYVLDGIAQLQAKGHGDPKPWSEI